MSEKLEFRTHFNQFLKAKQMKALLIILILTLLPHDLSAQDEVVEYVISSNITDSIGNPIPEAFVAALNSDSGMLIEQAITSDNGGFSLSFNAARTIKLFISYAGYANYISEDIEVGKITQLPTITLQSNHITMTEIVVVGQKQSPSIKIEKGVLVYTPRNSSTLSGSSALEVLKSTPGVLVDGEENISVAGQSGVLITINGKQTYMQKEELVNLLNSTPAASVSSVEVMNNPSAKYDAEGSAGIININMDRKGAEGFFASINLGLSYWENLRQNTEISLSYNHDKLTITANYSHAIGYYNYYYGMCRLQNEKEYYSQTYDTDMRNSIAGNVNLE